MQRPGMLGHDPRAVIDSEAGGAQPDLETAAGRCQVVCVNTSLEVSIDDGCCAVRTWGVGGAWAGSDQPVTAQEAVEKMVQAGMLDNLMNQVDRGDRS